MKWRIYLLTYFAYAMNHSCRITWSINKPHIKDQFQSNSFHLGLIDAIVYISYGIGSLFRYQIFGQRHLTKVYLASSIFISCFYSFLPLLGIFLQDEHQQINDFNFSLFNKSFTHGLNYINISIIISMIGYGFAHLAVWQCVITLVTEHWHVKVEGLEMGCWVAMISIGNIVGLSVSNFMIYSLKCPWQTTMILFAILNLFAALLMYFMIKDQGYELSQNQFQQIDEQNWINQSNQNNQNDQKNPNHSNNTIKLQSQKVSINQSVTNIPVNQSIAYIPVNQNNLRTQTKQNNSRTLISNPKTFINILKASTNQSELQNQNQNKYSIENIMKRQIPQNNTQSQHQDRSFVNKQISISKDLIQESLIRKLSQKTKSKQQQLITSSQFIQYNVTSFQTNLQYRLFFLSSTCLRILNYSFLLWYPTYLFMIGFQTISGYVLVLFQVAAIIGSILIGRMMMFDRITIKNWLQKGSQYKGMSNLQKILTVLFKFRNPLMILISIAIMIILFLNSLTSLTANVIMTITLGCTMGGLFRVNAPFMIMIIGQHDTRKVDLLSNCNVAFRMIILGLFQLFIGFLLRQQQETKIGQQNNSSFLQSNQKYQRTNAEGGKYQRYIRLFYVFLVMKIITALIMVVIAWKGACEVFSSKDDGMIQITKSIKKQQISEIQKIE